MVLSGSDLELYRVIMSCGELVGGEAEMIRRVLEDAIAEAVDHAPSLIILDDLDGLIPGGSEGPEPATTVVALAEFLGDLMDLYQVYFRYLASATALCLVISTVLATVLIRRDWKPKLINLNG
jgi:SpoVK/Ycf46/Vps4 family AAA+-type ATPase